MKDFIYRKIGATEGIFDSISLCKIVTNLGEKDSIEFSRVFVGSIDSCIVPYHELMTTLIHIW